MDGKQADTTNQKQAKLIGLLAEYGDVDTLLEACRQLRKAGVRKVQAFSPFPVHGIDAALGSKPTRLPWLVLLAGLSGLVTAVVLQCWTMAIDYPYIISGKPLLSLPAFVPVTFEMTVLFSAFTVFFSVLGLSKLPQLFHPLNLNPRFRKATDDTFFIYVQAEDPSFGDGQKLRDLLTLSRANGVEDVHATAAMLAPAWPRNFGWALASLLVAALIPFAMIAKARFVKSEKPRIHLLDDMDNQPKYKPQAANGLFADGRAMRPQIAGTVAQEDVIDVGDYFETAKDPQGHYGNKIPAIVALKEESMAKGQERYNIFCAPCHGISGMGDGLVSRRAEKRAEGTWVAPTSLHEERVRNQPVGETFNTISHGIRNMPSYGNALDPYERWTVVLYVKALQRSLHAPANAVPPEVLPTLP